MSDTDKLSHKRPSWDEYFLEIMDTVAKRASCDRGRSGCVIVKDNRILATGYVGAPAGVKSCDDAGHEMHTVIHADGTQSQHCIRTAHAEQNAIVHAARTGVALLGGTLYCNMTPCYACAKMIINSGIVRVVAKKDYHAGERSKEIFKEAGVKYELINNEVETYTNQ
ncbi:MAG: cytidine/deoxycytidylate deaminase family protein [Candidatus Nomurabacteria bacterium]|nr:cytidine/deoxycytidylate deaminase family protein [Candidatus Nomurabacteria bacterium]